MRQNATQSARSRQNRHSVRKRFGRFVGGWFFTPLVLAVILSIVFASFGYRLQKRESAELHAVFHNHLNLVTRVLEVSAENALRDGHHRDLQKILESVEAHDRDIDVLVAGPDGRAIFISERAGEFQASDLTIVDRTFSERLGLTMETGDGLSRHTLKSALLDSPDMEDAVLVIRKSMRELEKDLKQTQAHARTTTIAMTLLTFIFGLALAHLRVRKPLRKLRTIMDSLADLEGDLLPSVRGLPGLRSENEVHAVALAFQDLMERLREARQSVETLHLQREELTNRLADSSGRAKLLQFSSELAHEIGSPLQVILGRATLLEDRAERPDDVRRHARIVVEETQRIQRIIQRSLTETAELSGRLSTIDVSERTKEIAQLTRDRSGGRSVSYSFRFPKEPVHLRMDSDALDQILRNVFENAHEACADKGNITVELQKLPRGARLRVEDTGSGMSDELLEKALRPFFSTREQATGHGLGLPIVQRLSREFGIEFTMQSEDGVGTVVTFVFDDERTSALWEQSDVRTSE